MDRYALALGNRSASALVVGLLVLLLLMAKSLLFLKGADGKVKALGVSSGIILDVSENGNVGNYDLTGDMNFLKKHVEKMSIENIKTTCQSLGSRLSFSGRKPIKNDYVEAFMKYWQSIHKKATTVAGASSSGYANDQSEDGTEVQTDETLAKQFVINMDELYAGFITVNVVFVDLRDDPPKRYEGFNLKYDKDRSADSWRVEILEQYDDYNGAPKEQLDLGARNFRQVLHFEGTPLLGHSSMCSLKSLGITDNSTVEMMLYNEDDPKFQQLWEDAMKEVKQERPEWTAGDQTALDYLTKVNKNTGIRFNSDHFDDLLTKKLSATFADGDTLNEATDETFPMVLYVERINGKSRLFYHITKTNTGKDLYDALTAKGIDMENVAVKWAGTSSTIAMYDTLYTYACDGKEFVIRPCHGRWEAWYC